MSSALTGWIPKITLMPLCQATCTITATGQICHVSGGDNIGVHIKFVQLYDLLHAGGYYRVRLPHTLASEEGEDYINASHVNVSIVTACCYTHAAVLTCPPPPHPPQGYRAWNAYIATQGPLKETTGDFWRMVLERGSRCIVMLCEGRGGGSTTLHSCTAWSTPA